MSLFTGRYPAEHGIRDNVAPPLRADVPLLSRALPARRLCDGRVHRVRRAGAAVRAGAGIRSSIPISCRPERTADPATRSWPRRSTGSKASRSSSPGSTSTIRTRPTCRPGRYATRVRGSSLRRHRRLVRRAGRTAGRGASRAGALDNTLLDRDLGPRRGARRARRGRPRLLRLRGDAPRAARHPRARRAGRAVGSKAWRARSICSRRSSSWRGFGGRRDGDVGAQPRAGARAARRFDDQPSFAESLVPLLQYGWSDLRAVRDGRWKYILAPRAGALRSRSRSRRAAEPGGRRAGARARPARQHRGAPQAGSRARPIPSSAAAGIPPEMLERLGALGYVGPGASPVSPKRDSAKADPKDKVADYKALRELMQQGLIAIRAGRPSDAVAPLQAVGAARRGQLRDPLLPGARLHGARAVARGRRRVRAGDRQAAGRRRGVARTGREPGRPPRRRRRGPRLRETGRARARRRGRAHAARRGLPRRRRASPDAARVIREALAIDPKPAQYLEFAGDGPRRGPADGRRRARVRRSRRRASPPTACTPTTAPSRSSSSAAATKPSYK